MLPEELVGLALGETTNKLEKIVLPSGILCGFRYFCDAIIYL